MKLNLLAACCLSLINLTAYAQKEEWQDPNINQINRAPMHTNYFAYSNEEQALKGCKEILLGKKCRYASYRFLPNQL